MKTHPTIAGNAYVVFSKTGCTVTDSTGTLNKEVPAGDWLSIPAPSDALILTDDNAIVRSANFKLALAPSSVGSGGGSTGGGEPEGGVTLPDNYILYSADNVVEAYNLNKKSSLKHIFSDAKGNLDWDGDLLYLKNAEAAYSGSSIKRFKGNMPVATWLRGMFNNTPLDFFESSMPLATELYTMFAYGKGLSGDFTLDAPIAKNLSAVVLQQANLQGFYAYSMEITNTNIMCSGCSSLERVRLGSLAKVTQSGAEFDKCILDKDSILHLCALMVAAPKNNQKFTLGMNANNESDEEVLAAIAAAEAAGWVIIRQWNATTTSVATYNLRRRVRPVFAQVFVTEEGKRMLDWGHYVTDWEANGYTEFASLEEAKEHFNITE